MPQETDRKRAEGVYVSSFIYPSQGGPQSTRLYRIERVNGDASVDRLQVDQDEARAILAALQSELDNAAYTEHVRA